MMYHISLVFHRLYRRFFSYGKTVFGDERVPMSGALIVVPNHISDCDPWDVADLFPHYRPIHWFTKRELLNVHDCYCMYKNDHGLASIVAYPLAVLTVAIVKHSLTIQVDRDNPTARVNREALREARRVLESGGIIGIFGEGGKNRVGEIRPVFVDLARKHEISILPVKIGKYTIDVGESIIGEDLEKPEDPAEKASAIMAEIYKLDDYRRDGNGLDSAIL